MVIGTVIGSIVATRKHEKLVGNKLLLVESLAKHTKEAERFVAIDIVGAGVGEIVLVTRGCNALYATHHQDAPIDAAIVGIIDDGKYD